MRAPVRSVLIDFDGTACLHDVAEHLMEAFGDAGWQAWDDAWERGEVDTRTAIRAQVAPIRASERELIDFAVGHCPLDPTFAPFVAWCHDERVGVTMVSDGLGLYVEPLLHAGGIRGVEIVTNAWDDGRMAFPNGHPECIGCGTCKMLTVQRAPGPVAFVGEGASDRYGALYADIVFAKDALPAYCDAAGVPWLPWNDFDDVRRVLDTIERLPGPVAPSPCPGWTVPA
jgi:2,3-diketo-5-methylthio-1-phosphopentane phosphatase